jgi:hypothetical protein
MVRGKITGSLPAHAEIVLEGYVPPDRTHPKDRSANGPATMPAACGIPVLEISDHRNDPIVRARRPWAGA